jgi:hypothetical protein
VFPSSHRGGDAAEFSFHVPILIGGHRGAIIPAAQAARTDLISVLRSK